MLQGDYRPVKKERQPQQTMWHEVWCKCLNIWILHFWNVLPSPKLSFSTSFSLLPSPSLLFSCPLPTSLSSSLPFFFFSLLSCWNNWEQCSDTIWLILSQTIQLTTDRLVRGSCGVFVSPYRALCFNMWVSIASFMPQSLTTRVGALGPMW